MGLRRTVRAVRAAIQGIARIWATFLNLITSVSDNPRYREYCRRAATDEQTFATFKQDPGYREVLEHVSKDQGDAYFSIIKSNYPHLLDSIDKFKTNDIIGEPERFNYSEIGMISPTTLRYIKILGDLERLFGPLSDLNITEIGGGYGGQCKIIHDYQGCAAYQIHDLPEPLALTNRYLGHHGISLSPVSKPDLVISNYAFSECTKDTQAKYISNVIKESPKGYMICNFNSWNSYSLSALLRKIPNARTIGEDPLTHPKNTVIIWGSPSRVRGPKDQVSTMMLTVPRSKVFAPEA